MKAPNLKLEKLMRSINISYEIDPQREGSWDRDAGKASSGEGWTSLLSRDAEDRDEG